MKTRHAFLCAFVLGGMLCALEGCGQGTYRIPNVAPVVKQKPEEDILGGDSDSKTEEAKPESGGASETEEPKK